MTDVELDARVTVLEETGGADPSNGKYRLLIIILRVQCPITQPTECSKGIRVNLMSFPIIYICIILNIILDISLCYIAVTIAFNTVLTYNQTISFGSAVLFDDVLTNEGHG